MCIRDRGWTNFGGDAGAPLSYVHYAIAVLYVASIALLGYGFSDPNARALLGLAGKDEQE